MAAIKIVTEITGMIDLDRVQLLGEPAYCRRLNFSRVINREHTTSRQVSHEAVGFLLQRLLIGLVDLVGWLTKPSKPQFLRQSVRGSVTKAKPGLLLGSALFNLTCKEDRSVIQVSFVKTLEVGEAFPRARHQLRLKRLRHLPDCAHLKKHARGFNPFIIRILAKIDDSP